MKNLRFIDKKEDAQWSVTLNDGRIIALHNEDNKFYLDFGKLINLEHCVMFDHNEQIPDGWETTTLNDIIAQNLGKQTFCYNEIYFDKDIYPSDIHSEKQENDITNEIFNFFQEKGVNVSMAAIIHNFYAWMSDFKSGYRDTALGYHLFSPCGCNPLSMRYTTLNILCEDWQTTYSC